MTEKDSTRTMENVLNDYISKEVVSNPDLLPLKNDTPLIKSGILDSLSLLKLVLFLEERFGVSVGMEEVVPQNFETIDSICTLVNVKKEANKH